MDCSTGSVVVVRWSKFHPESPDSRPVLPHESGSLAAFPVSHLALSHTCTHILRRHRTSAVRPLAISDLGISDSYKYAPLFPLTPNIDAVHTAYPIQTPTGCTVLGTYSVDRTLHCKGRGRKVVPKIKSRSMIHHPVDMSQPQISSEGSMML